MDIQNKAQVLLNILPEMHIIFTPNICTMCDTELEMNTSKQTKDMQTCTNAQTCTQTEDMNKICKYNPKF